MLREEMILEKLICILGIDPKCAQYTLQACDDVDSLYQKIQRYEALRDAMELI